MFIGLEEIQTSTARMIAAGGKSVAEQQELLHTFLNEAHKDLDLYGTLVEAAGNPRYGQDDSWARLSLMAAAEALDALPKQEVRVTYRKVTKAKPRIGGVDYDETPGFAATLHIGTVERVTRNRDGQPYFLVADSNRAKDGEPGWTAVRLEGIETFGFVPKRRPQQPQNIQR